MTKDAIVSNLQHIAGIVVGKTVLRLSGLRYGKEHRGKHWFSTVSANIVADGGKLPLILFK